MFDSVTYGPIKSRRFGMSLGVNVLGPKKICSFDCPYCDLGPSEARLNQIKKGEITLPSVAQIDQQLRNSLRALRNAGTPFDVIMLSGNGEPSLHPDFAEVVAAILTARHEMSPEAKVMMLSNGAHFDSKRVIAAANELDERVIKVDAGNDRTFKMINQPLVRTNITKIYSNLRKLSDVIVQSFFIKGHADNTKSEDIEDWIEVMGMIQPKLVQICTINRAPADPNVQKVDEDTLYTIASKLKRRTQIESAVFF